MSQQIPKRKKNILKIKFDARLKDGLIKRGANYKPFMSSPNAYRMYSAIYFTPYVLITDNDLDAAIGMKLNREEKQLVFLKNSQFNSYVKYMATKDNLEQYTMDQLEEPGGIIEKNIQYILKLFFGNKVQFYLGDKEYTIQSYEWNRDFKLSNQGEAPNVSIYLRFLLTEGKESSFMDSVNVSCAQKWDSIKADYAFLTGFKNNPDLSDKENAEAKKKWKQDYADKEKDAPYKLQPTSSKGPNALRRTNATTTTPTTYSDQQLQASRERSRNQLAIAKMQSREADKQRKAAAAESEKQRQEAEKQRQSEKERLLLQAEQAEKQRQAAKELAEMKAAEAEKQRQAAERKTKISNERKEGQKRRQQINPAGEISRENEVSSTRVRNQPNRYSPSTGGSGKNISRKFMSRRSNYTRRKHNKKHNKKK